MLWRASTAQLSSLYGVIAALVLTLCFGAGCKLSGVGSAPPVSLAEVPSFGSNPGRLQMFKYVPGGIHFAAPLVVAIHGCAQTAQDFADHSGWPQIADRLGFRIVFPQQRITNNPARCFNWFLSGNSTRDSGEALSIKQMVDRMKGDYAVDARRVFVTGLSAGGAMTSIMLATYPDVFAAGAIMAGIPYRCAGDLKESLTCLHPGVVKTPNEWGDLVRNASMGTHAWPSVSIWQGTADRIVAPVNAREEMKQWTNVHGIGQAPSATDTLGRASHQIFRNQSGKEVVELYSINDMGHGQAVNPGSRQQNCGSAKPFFLNVGICSAYYASKFWGIAR
ncbi:MAG: PHB depolymerase family esterase [Deltaproteobacteria bacterium]|nr:PHB depolymerase family esterase [Deltaproteobacteria bacterium]